MWSALRLYWGQHWSEDREYFRAIHTLFGIVPNNIELYKLALIHRSASLLLEDGTAINNERLEFLGDAIIEAIISDYLFIEFPDRNEGFLTQLRSKIVNRSTLNQLGVELGLDRYIVLHSNGKSRSGSTSIYGNALEAMFGAIYLDQGFEFANRLFINKLLLRHIDIDEMMSHESDAKSRLIEWSQQHKQSLSFETLPSPHSTRRTPDFTARIYLDQVEVGVGSGSSKKSAEQVAARSAIEGIRQHFPQLTTPPSLDEEE